MAQYPNGDLLRHSPGRISAGVLAFIPKREDGGLRAPYTNVISKASGIPDGYGAASAVAPYIAGGMSCRTSSESDVFADMVSGAPMSASWSSVSGFDGFSLALIVNMNVAIAASSDFGEGQLSMTVGLGAVLSSDSAFSGSQMSMIVPFDGSLSMVSSFFGDLRGRLPIECRFTPFTELSPENLASAVWGYINGSATTGDQLAASGTAANPWLDPIGMEVRERLGELWTIKGLDVNNPLTVTQTSQAASTITLLMTGDGVTTTTVSREA